VHVWDPAVRLFHWSLAASFAIAYTVEDDFLTLHVWAGYAVVVLVAFRIVWGFCGPEHARWSSFVKDPAETVSYLLDEVRFEARRFIGHNPAGGAMAVALLISAVLTSIAGLSLYATQELSGPLAPVLQHVPPAYIGVIEDVHETLADLTLVLVGIHIAGVVLSSFQHRENLVKSMITGLKRSGTR
jgi:cytochrome b